MRRENRQMLSDNGGHDGSPCCLLLSPRRRARCRQRGRIHAHTCGFHPVSRDRAHTLGGARREAILRLLGGGARGGLPLRGPLSAAQRYLRGGGHRRLLPEHSCARGGRGTRWGAAPGGRGTGGPTRVRPGHRRCRTGSPLTRGGARAARAHLGAAFRLYPYVAAGQGRGVGGAWRGAARAALPALGVRVARGAGAPRAAVP